MQRHSTRARHKSKTQSEIGAPTACPSPHFPLPTALRAVLQHTGPPRARAEKPAGSGHPPSALKGPHSSSSPSRTFRSPHSTQSPVQDRTASQGTGITATPAAYGSGPREVSGSRGRENYYSLIVLSAAASRSGVRIFYQAIACLGKVLFLPIKPPKYGPIAYRRRDCSGPFLVREARRWASS